MTFYTRTLFLQAGWTSKSAKAGVFALFLLLGTSPAAATTSDSVLPGTEVPGVPSTLEIAEDEALADVAAPAQRDEVENTGATSLPAGTARVEKLMAAKPPASTSTEMKSKADDIIADKAVAAIPATVTSQAELSPVARPIETESTAEEVITNEVVAEKPATVTSQADLSPVAKPVEIESTTETSIVQTPAMKSGNPVEAPDKIATDTNNAAIESTTENSPGNAPMPVAEDVDLSEPVLVPSESTPPAALPANKPDNVETLLPTTEDEVKPPLVLLGEEVAPGTSARLSWSPDQHFDGISVPTPVLVVNGTKPGKTLCLTAAVHGDELNGIEIVRRVMYDLDPKELNGAVIGVPIVNLQGFRRNSRYLPDRRDLNRFFPGKVGGSSASRMAHSFFTQVISNCDALVDIHTGSFLRTNLPQLRADMSVPEVAELTEGFGATAVLHSSSTGGTLRRAAVLAGIPAVTLETGEPSRLQDKEIKHGTKGIQTLLTKLKMTRRVRVWGDPEPVYYKSVWVRADDGGLLFTSVKLGQRIRKGQVLGTITDPITNVRSELVSPKKGRVLGMALNQVVLPGFATVRIGIPSNEKEVVVPSDTLPENTLQKTAPEIPESVPTDVDIEDENS